MKLSSKNWGNWGVFQVDGTVDSIHTRIFTESFALYVETGPKSLVIDLSRCPFLSIGAIRYINQVSAYLSGSGGRLALLGVNDRIRRHIDIFVSWKKLKEINSLCEIIPIQVAHQLNAKEFGQASSVAEASSPSLSLVTTGDTD